MQIGLMKRVGERVEGRLMRLGDTGAAVMDRWGEGRWMERWREGRLRGELGISKGWDGYVPGSEKGRAGGRDGICPEACGGGMERAGVSIKRESNRSITRAES